MVPNPKCLLNCAPDSFAELPTLRHVGRDLDIVVWFLAYRIDAGVILYNGQKSNGNGDFLSLNLIRGGRVQLRFDLGSGPANLTTPEGVRPGEWHSVRITRAGPRGTLQLDEGKVVTGSSPGPLTELNLELPLYLGGFK